MFMGGIRPDDFEQVFVSIGRLACESHYRVGRTKITIWLESLGKERLLNLRAEHVSETLPTNGETVHRPQRSRPPDFASAYVQSGPKQCERLYGVGWRTVDRWLDECGREKLIEDRRELIGRCLTRKEMAKVLSRAFPVRVSPNAVHHAAQYLRKVRNGGWIISPTNSGDWWVGSRKRTAAELVELAKSKGFDPNLPLGAQTKVG